MDFVSFFPIWNLIGANIHSLMVQKEMVFKVKGSWYPLGGDGMKAFD